mgnify:FL=1
MAWQDAVFFIGSWIFVISLIPTIRGKQKPDFSTSLTTSFILYIFMATYFTLELTLSGIATFASATTWAILAYQRFQNDKKSKKQ